MLLNFSLTNIYYFSVALTIVPVKTDMRAEYCPSGLLVDGCPVELSQGALEYFDEHASRYVDALTHFAES